ncbi:hypothetical protein BV22DRAFT_785248 [Leucogyrophana mollusca]|uniref:Uncharacterized protein n=1 Tax=Leucogyrophana mollusca TaxID=85980 RepID=A0ACB8B5G7_9AGAM|nr:hypothetical protein BV22DRAFT_785248 [Leucogyrophana mollusca]
MVGDFFPYPLIDDSGECCSTSVRPSPVYADRAACFVVCSQLKPLGGLDILGEARRANETVTSHGLSNLRSVFRAPYCLWSAYQGSRPVIVLYCISYWPFRSMVEVTWSAFHAFCLRVLVHEVGAWAKLGPALGTARTLDILCLKLDNNNRRARS